MGDVAPSSTVLDCNLVFLSCFHSESIYTENRMKNINPSMLVKFYFINI